MNDDKSNNTDKDESAEAEAAINESAAEKKSSNDRSDGHKNNVLESDVVAKQQGRSSAAVKPGAFSANSRRTSNESVNLQLNNLEADIRAKQMSGASNTIRSSLEQDIAAKQQGRQPSAAPTKPGAYNQGSNPSRNDVNPALRQIEADIVAKQRAGVSYLKAPPPGTDAVSKRLTGSLPTTPGAHSSCTTEPSIILRDLEAEIRAKQGHNHTKANTETSRSDDDVNAKLQTKSGIHSVELKAGSFAKKQTELKSSSSTISNVNSDNDTPKLQKKDRALIVNNTTNDDIQNNSELSSKRTRGEINRSTFAGVADSNTLDIGNESKKDERTQSALQQGGNLNDLEYGEYGTEGGLAVALAVEEDDTNTYLPSAIEFDPDTKPPMYRNRRFRLYVWLMLATAFVGIVGAVLGIVLTAQEIAPSESIPYRATLGIRENLARIVSPEQLDDYNSPFKKALDWVTFSDPMALTPDSSRFLNRYVLAYLYYATSMNRPWTSSCAPSEDEEENCIDLFVRDAVDKDIVQKTAIKWFTNTDECEWAGIHCDGFNQIKTIELSKYGIFF